MPSAADHFARFVDVLADALDDHDVSGEELAARLYLSRFHLDRIVASVAGEPPRRFRRRVLLERAAYRLLDHRPHHPRRGRRGGVRGTRRSPAPSPAYGVGPGRWRLPPDPDPDRGTQRRPLPSPGGLRLPADRKVTPDGPAHEWSSTTSG